VTTRARARRTLATALVVVLSVAAFDSAWPAGAQTRRTTTTTTTTTTTIPVAPGETAPNGGPLLVPGDVGSEAPAEVSNDDNTGTVVALVISGLLLVALLLALLTYWFWRNTRPTKLGGPAPGPATAEG